MKMLKIHCVSTIFFAIYLVVVGSSFGKGALVALGIYLLGMHDVAKWILKLDMFIPMRHHEPLIHGRDPFFRFFLLVMGLAFIVMGLIAAVTFKEQ